MLTTKRRGRPPKAAKVESLCSDETPFDLCAPCADAEPCVEKACSDAPEKPARTCTPNPLVIDGGVPCPHGCGEHFGHKRRQKYPNGNQRYTCGGCGKPFVVRRKPGYFKPVVKK